jgi:hypothetical protein
MIFCDRLDLLLSWSCGRRLPPSVNRDQCVGCGRLRRIGHVGYQGDLAQ